VWLAGTIDDAELQSRVRATYESLIDAWSAARGGPGSGVAA
jgi:5-dehydro-2-deoxygluconokinase